MRVLEIGLVLFMIGGGVLFGLVLAAVLSALFVSGESRNLVTAGWILGGVAVSGTLLGFATGTAWLESAGRALGAAGGALVGTGVIAHFFVGVWEILGIGTKWKAFVRRRKAHRARKQRVAASRRTRG